MTAAYCEINRDSCFESKFFGFNHCHNHHNHHFNEDYESVAGFGRHNDIMFDEELVRPKSSFRASLGTASLNSTGTPSKNASPEPLAPTAGIRIVDYLPVSSNRTLIDNQESVLECLRPLLDDEISRSPTAKRLRSEQVFASSPSPAKRTRRASETTINSQSSEDIELTEYQAALWDKRFQELCLFKEGHGHCLVPHKWPENLPLATWVKRQRYQGKLRDQGKRSTLTNERKEALTRLGFVWDSHSATWEERFNELVEFKKVYGHTSVPSTHNNHSLSVWVQCQRRQWKLFQEEAIVEDTNSSTYQMKKSRFARLDAIDFVWEPRKQQLK